MTTQRFFAFVVVVLLMGAGSAGAQSVALEFQNGRVRLNAQNVPVSQILAEWARRGRTTIVNGERVPGPPVTLELNDVSEQQALDVVLRSASGYLVAPRDGAIAGESSFDRIFILPTSSRPTNPSALPPPVNTNVQRANDPGDADDDPAPFLQEPVLRNPPGARVPVPPGANARPTAPTPSSEIQEPDQPESAPANAPSNPFGVAPGTTRPGVITPGPPATPRNREP